MSPTPTLALAALVGLHGCRYSVDLRVGEDARVDVPRVAPDDTWQGPDEGALPAGELPTVGDREDQCDYVDNDSDKRVDEGFTYGIATDGGMYGTLPEPRPLPKLVRDFVMTPTGGAAVWEAGFHSRANTLFALRFGADGRPRGGAIPLTPGAVFQPSAAITANLMGDDLFVVATQRPFACPYASGDSGPLACPTFGVAVRAGATEGEVRALFRAPREHAGTLVADDRTHVPILADDGRSASVRVYDRAGAEADAYDLAFDAALGAVHALFPVRVAPRVHWFAGTERSALWMFVTGARGEPLGAPTRLYERGQLLHDIPNPVLYAGGLFHTFVRDVTHGPVFVSWSPSGARVRGPLRVPELTSVDSLATDGRQIVACASSAGTTRRFRRFALDGTDLQAPSELDRAFTRTAAFVGCRVAALERGFLIVAGQYGAPSQLHWVVVGCP